MVSDAFISYLHAADGLLAPRLQSALQRFAKPWWQRRAMRVFPDEASLFYPIDPCPTREEMRTRS